MLRSKLQHRSITTPKFKACALNSQLIDIYLLDYVTPKLPDNLIQISPNSKISNAWAKILTLIWQYKFTLEFQIYTISKLFMT